VWPPAGIALAAILLLGYRAWPAIFVGAFLVNLTTAGGIPTSVAIATGNTLEAVAGAWLVNCFADGKSVFDRPQGVFKFALVAAISAVVSPVFGVTSLALDAALEKLLARRGHLVAVSHDVRSAMEAAVRSKFDLLISDIALPDGTGMDLMKQLRAIANVPGIAISALAITAISNEVYRPASPSISLNPSSSTISRPPSNGRLPQPDIWHGGSITASVGNA
jgi:MASE1/Response regulator receiver domain